MKTSKNKTPIALNPLQLMGAQMVMDIAKKPAGETTSEIAEILESFDWDPCFALKFAALVTRVEPADLRRWTAVSGWIELKLA